VYPRRCNGTNGKGKEEENVAEFRYLGITLTKQKCNHEEIKSRDNLHNSESLSSCLLPKNVTIKRRQTIILPVVS
jgi:hypothetical protein